jgi:hypothetical protein
MNSGAAPLGDVMEALLTMNPRAIACASAQVEAVQQWSEEQLRSHAASLNRTLALARSAAEHWQQVCEQTSLSSGGYSALGTPATTTERHDSGGLRG